MDKNRETQRLLDLLGMRLDDVKEHLCNERAVCAYISTNEVRDLLKELRDLQQS